jgi:hypothetical protein
VRAERSRAAGQSLAVSSSQRKGISAVAAAAVAAAAVKRARASFMTTLLS